MTPEGAPHQEEHKRALEEATSGRVMAPGEAGLLRKLSYTVEVHVASAVMSIFSISILTSLKKGGTKSKNKPLKA